MPSKQGAEKRTSEAIDRYVRELVDKAPPLTDEQRDRLAVLLRSGK